MFKSDSTGKKATNKEESTVSESNEIVLINGTKVPVINENELVSLDNTTSAIIICENSAVVYLEKQNQETGIRIFDSISIDDIKRNKMDIIMDEDEENDPTLWVDTATFEELLDDSEPMLSDLVELIYELQHTYDIDGNYLIELILKLRDMYSTTRIYNELKQMDIEELWKLVESDNPVFTFIKLVRPDYNFFD